MTLRSPSTKSAEIRSQLDHPIIDSDGHTVEFTPVYLDYLRDVGGTEVAERYTRRATQMALGRASWPKATWEERRDTRWMRPPWWGLPAGNTLDRVTATLPKLLYQRLDDMGLDYTILYPTDGLFLQAQADEELRRASCDALNRYHADIFGEYADRITPAAIIPMHTPEEAIAELEYAASIGLKVMLIPSYVARPIPAIARKYPDDPMVLREATWLDSFGLDSDYDYDPFWRRCIELGVAVGAHSSGMGFSDRRSISSYVFNHMGHFGAAGELLARSLFLGGVTYRFPNLRVVLLEGGVTFGCRLYADLIGHWEKRNIKALEANLNPARLDRELAHKLFREYDGRWLEGKLDQLDQALGIGRHDLDPALRDEFAACHIATVEDIRDRFIPNFYYGCEADDPLNVWAFDRRVNPLGVQIKALLGSDIGHWDVPDMTEVLEEAYELVEHDLLSPADFRAFACDNAIEFYARLNPDFFKGTVIERTAAEVLKSSSSQVDDQSRR